MTENSCGLRYLELKNHLNYLNGMFGSRKNWKSSSWSQVTGAAAAADDDDV